MENFNYGYKEIDAISTVNKFIGSTVWLEDNRRHWVTVDGYFYDSDYGFCFSWHQIDESTGEESETGAFTTDDIGKSVLFGEDAERKEREFEEYFGYLAENYR